MTDVTITAIGDATIRSTRPSLVDGSGDWVRVKSGEQRGLLRPDLDDITGRTVTSAVLTGRVGPGWVAQNITVTPITERWSPGRATWANQPTTDGTAAIVFPVGALPAGSLVSFDIQPMIQAVADGAEWFGIRVQTNSTATGQRFYATDSGEPAWELAISLSDRPDIPSNLRPDGGAVATGEPILAWDFVDLGGDSTIQAESKVQVDTPAAGLDPDDTSPDYDSGWQDNSDPQWDLSAVTYTPPAASVNPTYWRVRVRDGDGNQSETWSDWASFTEDSLPTLVIDSPTGAFGDPSPQVQAHLTSGTIASWKAYVTGPKRNDIRAESGWTTGALDWQVPFRNEDGKRVIKESEPGWLYVRVKDDVDRAVAVGQKAYVDAWVPLELTNSDTVTPVTGLSVAQLDDGDPRSEWTWSRTEAATGWVIGVGDEELARLEPEDVTSSGGTYTWIDNGEPPPLQEQDLWVKALEDGEASRKSIVTRTHTVAGVWLLPSNPDDGAPVRLAGTAVEGFGRSDARATYTTLTGDEVDIIYGTPGRTGTFEGAVDSRQDVWAALDTIRKLRKSYSRKARLVWGSQSILVRLRDPDATPHGDILPNNLMHVVRFGFVQVGE